jgi:hypothetical protein
MAPKRSKESRSTKKATPSPQRRLRALERWKAEFGPAAAAQKRALLGELERARLQRAKDVLALHETLCFLRAYPDDEETLAVVERLLRTFAGRRDLVAHADELVNSGVAGTEIVYPFYAEMARWLASRWPDRLHVVWDEEPDRPRLERLLPHLVLPAEAACMEELAMSVEDWCARLAPNETDAAFLVRRIERLGLSPSMHELLYQELGLVLRLAADADLERDGGARTSRSKPSGRRSPSAKCPRRRAHAGSTSRARRW